MPDKRPSIRNAKQCEALKKKGDVEGTGGADRELAWRSQESVTPSPYGWPMIFRTRADRGGP